jgi:hypothetical protein
LLKGGVVGLMLAGDYNHFKKFDPINGRGQLTPTQSYGGASRLDRVGRSDTDGTIAAHGRFSEVPIRSNKFKSAIMRFFGR